MSEYAQEEYEPEGEYVSQVPAQGQPGLEHWAGPEGFFKYWNTVKFKTQTADTGAQALSHATKFANEEGSEGRDVVASAEDLTQLVAMWAAAAFVNTNETRRQRKKEPFKSVSAVYKAFSKKHELWQASHLALACLACGYFPVILAPGTAVDCSFSLPPVMDMIVDMMSTADPFVLVFYWTHRKTVTKGFQETSYKHFQPLIDPYKPAWRLSELPLEVLDQLKRCKSAMSRHRFAFLCTEARDEHMIHNIACSGQERAAQLSHIEPVSIFAKQTESVLTVSLPKEGFGPPGSLSRSAHVNMLNSIILDQIQPAKGYVQDSEVVERPQVDSVYIQNPEALKTKDDWNSIKALGFEQVGQVVKRSVRGTNDFIPVYLTLPWREYHVLDLEPEV